MRNRYHGIITFNRILSDEEKIIVKRFLIRESGYSMSFSEEDGKTVCMFRDVISDIRHDQFAGCPVMNTAEEGEIVFTNDDWGRYYLFEGGEWKKRISENVKTDLQMQI